MMAKEMEKVKNDIMMQKRMLDAQLERERQEMKNMIAKLASKGAQSSQYPPPLLSKRLPPFPSADLKNPPFRLRQSEGKTPG